MSWIYELDSCPSVCEPELFCTMVIKSTNALTPLSLADNQCPKKTGEGGMNGGIGLTGSGRKLKL